MDTNEITAIPRYGIKLKLNYVYPEDWSPGKAFSNIRNLLQLIPMMLRSVVSFILMYLKGRAYPLQFPPVKAQQIYGVPIGGIGAGTIGRGFKGEFCRYNMKPGIYEYNTVEANQFIVTIKNKSGHTIFQSILSTYKKQMGTLSSWKSLIDGSKCSYTGLYPRSWTEYDLSQYGIKLICRQISPVLPHNYKDSSLPCAVFVWNVENHSNEELQVTITFTFKNGTGNYSDKKAVCTSESAFSYNTEGIVLHHDIDGTPCSYTLAAKATNNVDVTKCVYFDPTSSGADLWNQLFKDGKLSDSHGTIYKKGEVGVGIAASVEVPAKNEKLVEMALSWSMPEVTFFYKKMKYKRYYTKYFPVDATLEIADYALSNYENWEKAIFEWQQPVLDDRSVPDWYKGALFNETYFVSDGGTFWFVLDENEAHRLPDDDPRLEYGRFGYLEGHEYRLINTYDVHFYSSFVFTMNWPKLGEVVQYDFRDAVFRELPQKVIELYDGVTTKRKIKNTLPHDLGDPYEEPYDLINAYPLHDVSKWKDLNVKFVLAVFKDFIYHEEKDKIRYLSDMYDALIVLMTTSEGYDTDNDGLIDNDGKPDQTYDTWVMTGASAYCGGLWLAAVYAMTVMADFLGRTEDKKKYEDIFSRGKVSFCNKLWNGQFFDFDVVRKGTMATIMADQLCAQWYLNCCGCNYQVFDKDKVQSALKVIYNNNVQMFCNGKLGAVNGFLPSGKMDETTNQSTEMWVAVTYSLTALMLFEDMNHLAWKTSGGMYETMTQNAGLAYQTPEALYGDKFYRSLGYMRPLDIWSIQFILNGKKKDRT